MEISSIELSSVQSRAQKPLYPSREKLIEIMRPLEVEVIHYIPGDRDEEGVLSLKFPEGKDVEILIQEIKKALSPYRILETDFDKRDKFSF